jgi:PAS domain S-box-containing protein
VVFAGCLAATAVVSLTALRHDRARDQARFNTRVEALERAMLDRMSSYIHVLKGAAGLFAASQTVDRDEWRAYCARLDLAERYRGLQVLGFIANVPRTNLDHFLASTRNDKAADYNPAEFRVWPLEQKSNYAVVTYVEPVEGNRQALGYDISSDATRREAAEEAAESGEAVLTRRIKLVQADGTPGVLLLLPIYANGTHPVTPTQRHACLQGWVYAAFIMEDLMAGLPRFSDNEVGLEIYDGSQPTPEALLYNDDHETFLHALEPAGKGLFRSTITISIAHRPWTLHFHARPAFVAALGPSLPSLIAAGGLCISLLVFGIARLLLSCQRHATDLANQMTWQLRLQERAISSSSEGFFILDASRSDYPIIYTNPAFRRITGYSDKECQEPTSLLPRGGATQPDLPRLRAALRGGCEQRTVLREYRKDGRSFWAEVSLWPVMDGGKQITHQVGIVKDITDRKLAEDQAAKAERRYHELVDNLNVGVYRNTPGEAGRFLEANPAIVALFEADSKEEFLRHKVRELYVDAAQRTKFAEKLAQAGWVKDEELELRTLKGHQFWASVSATMKRDEDGQIFFDGILTDITGRKQAEQALRLSQERFALAVQGTNDGIWDWNVVTDEAYFSPRWKSMLGYQEHEIANTFAAWQGLLHPDDRERARATIAAYFEGKTEAYELEHRLRHKDGSYRWILARGLAVRDGQGKPVRMAGSHVDLTERKRAAEALRFSEERLHLALDGADLGLWDWNLLTDEVFYNDRWLAMLGYRRSEVGSFVTFWEELVHPEDKPDVMKALRAHLDGASSLYETEHRCRTKAGAYRWFLDRGRVVERDGAGKPTRMSGTHLDITERKQAERELRVAYTELAKSQEALKRTVEELRASHKELETTQLQLIQAAKLESVGTLAAGVAHEVKNPLQTILMGVAYLSHNLPSENRATTMALGEMREAVQRANLIIRELLHFSADTRFEMTEEDLNTVLERSLWLTNNELVASRIAVVRELASDLPLARFDRGKLEQVFINLIINAIQAMSQGGTLTVRSRAVCVGRDAGLPEALSHQFKPGEMLLLAQVQDTGVGIPPAQMARIFDPFFTTKPRGVGTGLGLSIVKRILDLHDGAIDVQNVPAGGALVSLVLRV